MRIGVDMLYSQTPTANHGIGNYSFSHLHFLAERPEIEVFYFEPKYDGLTRNEFVKELKRFIQENQIEVFHLPSPMQVPYPDVFSNGTLSGTYVTATVYDLIPLVYEDIYLRDPGARSSYNHLLNMLRHMDHLLAISENTRQDLIHIGIPPERVTNIGFGRDDSYFPLSNPPIDDLADRISIDKKFILAFTAGDPRKNAERLVHSFGKVLRDDPLDVELVFVNDTPEQTKSQLRSIANQYGVAKKIRFTGRLSKNQLLRLYNRATFLALPTLYEGLGLPAVEAMQCGLPVLTSNSSSMPEVVGDAGILVNPLDVQSISNGIRALLTNEPLRSELRQRGLERMEQFRWDSVAERTVNVYQSMLSSIPGSASTEGLVQNVSGSTEIVLRPNRFSVVSRGRGGRRGTYFSFNLAEVPANMSIERATLRIPVRNPRGGVRVYAIRNGWSEKIARRRSPRVARRPRFRAKRYHVTGNQLLFFNLLCTRMAKNWQREQLKNHGVYVPRMLVSRPELIVVVS